MTAALVCGTMIIVCHIMFVQVMTGLSMLITSLLYILAALTDNGDLSVVTQASEIGSENESATFGTFGRV